MADQLTTLSVNQIQPNPFQPRSVIEKEDLTDLTSSIKEHGVLEPLLIAQTPAGYQIIAGERRWRASKAAGLDEVPVVIKKTTPKGMLEMALVENVQRVNLSAMERARAFQQLIREFGYNNQQISQKIGKSSSFISNSLRLLELPDAIKDGLSGKQITEGHARALLTIPNQSHMLECYKIVLKEDASVRRTEELARRYRDTLIMELDKRTINKGVDTRVEKWQKQISNIFNQKKTKVKLARSSRQTKVTIVFKGTPEETQAELEKLLELSKSEN